MDLPLSPCGPGLAAGFGCLCPIPRPVVAEIGIQIVPLSPLYVALSPKHDRHNNINGTVPRRLQITVSPGPIW
jgi:hypothetical protein